MKKTLLSILIIGISLVVNAQTLSKYIVVDQFGYQPEMEKVAIIRDPQTGFDASETFTPGSSYAVVNTSTGIKVFTGSPVVWSSGATDAGSGDKVWWFDFSSVTQSGSYYILDVTQNLKSFNFNISVNAYKDVLKSAVRVLFYQRAGCNKSVANAGAGWADGASHLKPLQDKNCRPYNDKTNASKEYDLQGAWFDAGDYNKYAPWTANYIVKLLRAYADVPQIWTDDYNIPESGNTIPDIIDETKWGMDWLLRMQRSNGSVLSVMGISHASPASAATGQSVYGPATTNATFTSAAAFAYGAYIFGSFSNPTFKTYADTLKARAIKAWTWGIANPSVVFDNTKAGVAAGNQETDSLGRVQAKITAACYLYLLTSDAKYKTEFDNVINSARPVNVLLFRYYDYVSQYEAQMQDLLMFYTTVPGATPAVVNKIKTALVAAFNKAGDFNGKLSTDPYRSFILGYNWGSNAYKSTYGIMYYDLQKYNLEPTKNAKYLSTAKEYVHYLHGANPLNLAYLSNMSSYGAENSVTEMYHTWFCDGSAKWDKVGKSTYGPAPGFLVGGPNDSYTWDNCCNGNTCGSTENNNICTSEIVPVKGEPAMKFYKDFNTNWPLNSWALSEPSLGYQTDYIRLLAITVADAQDKDVTGIHAISSAFNAPDLFPNPVAEENTFVNISILDSKTLHVEVYNSIGVNVSSESYNTMNSPIIEINVKDLAKGIYMIKLATDNGHAWTNKLVKL